MCFLYVQFISFFRIVVDIAVTIKKIALRLAVIVKPLLLNEKTLCKWIYLNKIMYAKNFSEIVIIRCHTLKKT